MRVCARTHTHTHNHTRSVPVSMAGACQEKRSCLEGGHISLNRVRERRKALDSIQLCTRLISNRMCSAGHSLYEVRGQDHRQCAGCALREHLARPARVGLTGAQHRLLWPGGGELVLTGLPGACLHLPLRCWLPRSPAPIAGAQSHTRPPEAHWQPAGCTWPQKLLPSRHNILKFLSLKQVSFCHSATNSLSYTQRIHLY